MTEKDILKGMITADLEAATQMADDRLKNSDVPLQPIFSNIARALSNFKRLNKITHLDGLLDFYHKNVKESVNPHFPLNHMNIEIHVAPMRPMSPNFKYHLIVRFPYGSHRSKNKTHLSVMGDTVEEAISKMNQELLGYFSGV